MEGFLKKQQAQFHGGYSAKLTDDFTWRKKPKF